MIEKILNINILIFYKLKEQTGSSKSFIKQ